MKSSEIPNEEWIYRRIPAWLSYYDPAKKRLSPQAFLPRNRDIHGISLIRSSLLASIEEAAFDLNNKGREFYIAKIKASDIRRLELTVIH
ncbi:MAG: hypothetical protein KC917_21305, partial [Candidatus Omnitrophica bacterium]|nr:hypothetical protein [Candidatus Omnitrophota bacterium]